jgi:hypothetical protein
MMLGKLLIMRWDRGHDRRADPCHDARSLYVGGCAGPSKCQALKVSEEEMAAINIKHATFHGDWNYTIRPNSRQNRLLIT